MPPPRMPKICFFNNIRSLIIGLPVSTAEKLNYRVR